jgi:hypothetical protein
MCGFVDHILHGTWETSWLELLITTGITKEKVEEALKKSMSAYECESLFWHINQGIECP